MKLNSWLTIAVLAAGSLAVTGCGTPPESSDPSTGASEGGTGVDDTMTTEPMELATDANPAGTGAEAPAEGAADAPAGDPFQEGTDLMVPAAAIAKAIDGGLEVVFVDARPPLDYESGHIAGAVNVPYFEAEKHLALVPKDKWAIVYCECPRAEAQQTADKLLQNGYTKVKIIDEGLAGWRDLGKEIVAGTAEPTS